MNTIIRFSPFLAILILAPTACSDDSQKNASSPNRQLPAIVQQPGAAAYHTVTFDSRGGSAVPKVAIESGKTLTEPDNKPEKKDGLFDLAFDGWYIDKEFKEPFKFDAMPIDADLTLYAKYDENVYLVSTEEQLAAVATTNLAGVYRLRSSIELQTDKWKPIGNKAHPFTGRFEGGGHVIKNLKVDMGSTAAPAGLFGVVNGEILAVGLENVSIKSSFTHGSGGLVGENHGRVSGYAVGGTIDGVSDVGGLVGFNAPRTGIVIGYTAVEVVGASEVGGLVGENKGIVVGYATGKVTGQVLTGGLVGNNESRGVVTGYARGKVVRSASSSDIAFGWLIGGNFNRTIGSIIGYHSAGESQFISGTAITNSKGEHGLPISIDASTSESSFVGFGFGEAGEWSFTAGHWPSLSFFGAPVDQDKVTTP